MYYLKDAQGNTVRAVQWTSDDLIFIRRHDNNRIETCSDLKYYDAQKIKYTVLDKVSQKQFEKTPSFSLAHKGAHLTLVKDSEHILKNVALIEDDAQKFKFILERTGLSAAILAALTVVVFLLRPKAENKPELEVVQVMDRQQMERTFVVPPSEQKPVAIKPVQVQPNQPRPTTKPKLAKRTTPSKSSGVLGILGSLNKSQQKGGLNLDQAESSPGIGRGGREGSGGVQTSVYAKGLFSAPLGTGGKVNGGGGYGTKGKGGGQAGYGKIQLVGQGGDSYFQPVESEAFVEGGLDRNEISAVIQRHLSEVRFCYEQGLQNKPRLSGRVAIRFLIGAKGLVTLAQVDQSSLGHAPVEGCIRDRLKTWNFPRPEGGVTVKVTYPFILRRVSDS
jgi:hypothetical protein